MSDDTKRIKERWNEHLPEEITESGIESQEILAIRETPEGWSIVTKGGQKKFVNRNTTLYTPPAVREVVASQHPKTGPRMSFATRRRGRRPTNA